MRGCRPLPRGLVSAPRPSRADPAEPTENKEGWHGKALSADQAKQAIEELGGESNIVIQVPKPAAASTQVRIGGERPKITLPTYKLGDAAQRVPRVHGRER